MTPWTKGPWTVTKTDPPGFVGIDGASFKIRTPIYATDLTYEDGRQRTADAHLMSASPELAEAVIKLLTYAIGTIHNLDPEARAEVEKDIVEAKAALNKAGGQV